MMGGRRSSGNPSPFRFRWAYAPILAAMVLFALKFSDRAWHDHVLASELNAVHARLHHEDQANHQMRRAIRYERTTAFVRREARSWGWVSPGDRPVVIVYRYRHPMHKPAPVAKPPATPAWQQWWNAFFGGSGH